MKISNFTIRFEPAAGGGYNVVVPAIPEIKAYGKTLKEAKTLAKEAVQRYIDALKANEPVHDTTEREIDSWQAKGNVSSQIGRP
jgi:predicted RNase H-like HicB family nuclease